MESAIKTFWMNYEKKQVELVYLMVDRMVDSRFKWGKRLSCNDESNNSYSSLYGKVSKSFVLFLKPWDFSMFLIHGNYSSFRRKLLLLRSSILISPFV